MEVADWLSTGVPLSVEVIADREPWSVSELWSLARAYSRLRHRTCPRREPAAYQCWSTLKTHCVRLALSRCPERFLVFRDPGKPQLWLIYSLDERRLLHLPASEDLSAWTTPTRWELEAG
jgi:hypothetical protein